MPGPLPEGGRSQDGGLLPFKNGAARIAHTVGVPIVPVSILGAYEAWPRHRWLPRLFRPIVVKYHRPIPCSRTDKADLREAAAATTAEVRRILQRRLASWEVVRGRRKARR